MNSRLRFRRVLNDDGGLKRRRIAIEVWPGEKDLRAETLTVNQARVLVEYRVRIEEPKSRNGQRTLPLDGELVAALTGLRKRQLEESTTAGAANRSRLAELDWYQGGEYVITDEAGTPVHPEWYSDEFGRLLRRAGLRRITPARFASHDPDAHGARGACRSRSSASGRATMTRRSRRRPTSTRARKTCNAARPHSPGFTRSLRAVRNCETTGPKTRIQGLDDLRKQGLDLPIRGALGGTRTPNLLIRRLCRGRLLPAHSCADLPRFCSLVRGRWQR